MATRIPLNRRFESERAMRRNLDMAIAELDLPLRIVNALEQDLRIVIVRQLLEYKPGELLARVHNFGPTGLSQVQEALAKIGFHTNRTSSRVPTTSGG